MTSVDLILNEVICRIVEMAHPERIILFGSAARGERGPDSDLDLLVVKSGVHRRRLAHAIYRNLIGVGFPVDVVVVTPEDIERYQDAPGLIIEPALREGKVVYERPTASAVPGNGFAAPEATSFRPKVS
jgi:predicted nucleotidyltransferase